MEWMDERTGMAERMYPKWWAPIQRKPKLVNLSGMNTKKQRFSGLVKEYLVEQQPLKEKSEDA